MLKRQLTKSMHRFVLLFLFCFQDDLLTEVGTLYCNTLTRSPDPNDVLVSISHIALYVRRTASSGHSGESFGK